jgi:glycosyltransferase involved in cell wall biosynthesis
LLPKISIVTPSYNQGQFLEETIRSVLSQNYPRLEFIIMDGGSTDNSVEIIQRYAPKIDYWVTEKDNGQADALRKGFARATGELLGWLNSDDIFHPHALLAIGETYEAYSNCLIAGNVSVFSGSQSIHSHTIRQRNLNQLDMIEAWTRRATYSQPGVFFPRAAYQQAGGVDPTLRWIMDRDLMIRMLRTHEVKYVERTVAGARLHAAAKTCAQAGHLCAEVFQVSRRYWNELSYSERACRFYSVLGLGRSALGRIYHRDLRALPALISEMTKMATGNFVRNEFAHQQ